MPLVQVFKLRDPTRMKTLKFSSERFYKEESTQVLKPRDSPRKKKQNNSMIRNN
jgi:hypothetical protein